MLTAAKADIRFRRRRSFGQVVTEYVIMLVLALVLALTLLALYGGFSNNGERLLTLVGYDIP